MASSQLLAALMAVQALAGLLWPSAYRDAAWIKLAWFGNDCVTLAVAAILVASSRRAMRSERAWLVWLGCLGYGVYNYCYYLFGAALSVFLPLYVVLFLVSTVALGGALVSPLHLPSAQRFRPKIPSRILAGYLVLMGTSLGLVWLSLWAGHIFWGKPTPIEPDAFQLVFAVDTSTLIPAIACGGILLWRRSDWGYVVGGLSAVLGSIYLCVLLVNSVLMIRAGLAEPPGEVVAWATLGGLTTLAALAILSGVPGAPRGK